MSILKNRLTFFLPVNTGYVTEGLPDHRFLDFYSGRSSASLYCAIVGNVVVPGGHGSNSSTPVLSDAPIWGQIAEAIKVAGSKPGVQLATAWQGYTGNKKFRSSEPKVFLSEARQLVDQMDADAIEKVLRSFELGAHIAIEHGFEHIQIHAAHGYLLSLLVDQRINHRAAVVLDRLVILAEQIKSRGAESSIRISMRTGDEVFDSVGMNIFHDSIVRLPFDFIDLSSGFYNVDKRLIYPATSTFIESRFLESVRLGIRHPHRPFIISGHVSAKNWDDMAPNLHPGLCRDLIANPNFLSEHKNGCRNYSKCHYYSRGTDSLTCGRWTKK
ncbi:hypothetical protein CN094_36840 [Sinorhizobium meliloti]|nr:hypothetical protein SMRU11_01575 [Sinorhizobium meliloti RU11/001]RVG53114.1 hypothetical protein CN222_37015 [Sinorhizobium meliloti]RVH49591.1 hypothetical protein CN213_30635 [Sinorhizobium meliloti]RVL88174.1 hypothetical protein CN136_37275 [Sinorhizobium meliloti]RVN26276.1 hypothetical protein CN118_36075 [Sinorhizobium meliloti]